MCGVHVLVCYRNGTKKRKTELPRNIGGREREWESENRKANDVDRMKSVKGWEKAPNEHRTILLAHGNYAVQILCVCVCVW